MELKANFLQADKLNSAQKLVLSSTLVKTSCSDSCDHAWALPGSVIDDFALAPAPAGLS